MEILRFDNLQIENQQVHLPLPDGIQFTIKREDKNHPLVSGNKLRKLKYNIQQALAEGKDTILTFGGAYSNHIAATAAAGNLMGIKTIGVIRGDELECEIDVNPTLKFCKSCGMQLFFVSRSDYRNKTSPQFLEMLVNRFGSNIYIAPEGGTNALAVKGTAEILTPQDSAFDVICTAVGTGGTIAGIIEASEPHQTVIGFPALKGADFLENVIRQYTYKTNWHLVYDYNFGGYAKVNDELIDFLNDFNNSTGIPLDPIYVGKMIFAIFALASKGYFAPNTKILAIHTGGLQGIKGIIVKQI
jgi:1-aminocyclopropane-1-carboxylate deaminase